MGSEFEISVGHGFPLGATLDEGGVNFSIASLNATSVELLLYEKAGSEAPFQIIQLEPHINRRYFIWHVYVKCLPAGTFYTWRVDGPTDTEHTGYRFNSNKELLDPWAWATSDLLWDRKSASDPAIREHKSMRSIVVSPEYDWGGDQRVTYRREEQIIYELHVGGFTRHPSSGVTHPGTFSALVEKIPYLQELGVTHVELLPVMAFDEQDAPESVTDRGNKNYWGYSTHSFYSPHSRYCVTPDQGTHLTEFRDMVKALHQAGIGIILDVVFNHTAEGGADGPTISFKGLFNEIFYHLEPGNRSHYRDYTGCGNTINCNHPMVTRFIVNCLEFWVREMHVDGFRFDLASVLGRAEDGEPIFNAPALWSIELSHELIRTPIFAEAWDARGLYQVGAFPGFRWTEWNGRYRDVIRRFVTGEPGLISEVATSLSGSNDLYEPVGRLPVNSLNFITCHDGFTLNDLVSYNSKHNEANGEGNRDGHNANCSWNCGVEGETEDPDINRLRRIQAKNLISTLFLSQGVPMILAGDEVLRTQGGNNNGYCQDNETNWFNWKLVSENSDMLRFFQKMIAFRKRHSCLRRLRFLTGELVPDVGIPDVWWHGKQLEKPLWQDPNERFLAFTLAPYGEGVDCLHVILNMGDSDVAVELPSLEKRKWYRVIDTSLPSPEDIVERNKQTPMSGESMNVNSRCVVVLEGRPD